MNIIEITDPAKKQEIARYILEALPEWFGIPEAREDYITNSADKTEIIKLSETKEAERSRELVELPTR